MRRWNGKDGEYGGKNGAREKRNPSDRQYDSQQSYDESQLRKNEDRTQRAYDMHGHCKQDKDGPSPHWSSNVCGEGVATAPQQPHRHEGDQKAVAVLFLRSPAPDQFKERPAECKSRQQCRNKSQYPYSN